MWHNNLLMTKESYLSSNRSMGLLVKASLWGCDVDGTAKLLFGGFCWDCKSHICLKTCGNNSIHKLNSYVFTITFWWRGCCVRFPLPFLPLWESLLFTASLLGSSIFPKSHFSNFESLAVSFDFAGSWTCFLTFFCFLTSAGLLELLKAMRWEMMSLKQRTGQQIHFHPKCLWLRRRTLVS